jgi:hypothetical protein
VWHQQDGNGERGTSFLPAREIDVSLWRRTYAHKGVTEECRLSGCGAVWVYYKPTVRKNASPPFPVISSTLNTEEIRSSETSGYNKPTRRHIPEDAILHSQRPENFKTYRGVTGHILNLSRPGQGSSVSSGQDTASVREPLRGFEPRLSTHPSCGPVTMLKEVSRKEFGPKLSACLGMQFKASSSKAVPVTDRRGLYGCEM